MFAAAQVARLLPRRCVIRTPVEWPVTQRTTLGLNWGRAPKWSKVKRRIEESTQTHSMLPLVFKVGPKEEDCPRKIPANAVGQGELSRQFVLVQVIVMRPCEPPFDLSNGQILGADRCILEGIVRHLACGKMPKPLGEPLARAMVDHKSGKRRSVPRRRCHGELQSVYGDTSSFMHCSVSC